MGLPRLVGLEAGGRMERSSKGLEELVIRELETGI